MRVTSKMMVDNAIQHMGQNLESIRSLQDKIASGKQVRNLSDDPYTVSTVLSMRSIVHTVQSYLDTANVANDWMSSTEQAIKQMAEVATRASTLAKSGVSDTMGSSERLSLAAEVNAILEQAIALANESHQGKFLFAGFQVRPPNPPFAGVDLDADGDFDAVNYSGDAGNLQQQIGPGQLITTNVQGQAAFSRLFQAIIDTRETLNNDDIPGLQTAITDLTTAMDELNVARTTNGARQRQLKSAISRLETTVIEAKNMVSKKEDVNMAEAISMLTYQETVFQSTLEVSKRAIATVTLFDYLR